MPWNFCLSVCLKSNARAAYIVYLTNFGLNPTFDLATRVGRYKSSARQSESQGQIDYPDGYLLRLLLESSCSGDAKYIFDIRHNSTKSPSSDCARGDTNWSSKRLFRKHWETVPCTTFEASGLPEFFCWVKQSLSCVACKQKTLSLSAVQR